MVLKLEEELERIFQEYKSRFVALIESSVFDSNERYKDQPDLQRKYLVEDGKSTKGLFLQSYALGGLTSSLTTVRIGKKLNRKSPFWWGRTKIQTTLTYHIYGALVQHEGDHNHVVRISPPLPRDYVDMATAIDILILVRINRGVLDLGYQRSGDDRDHYFTKTSQIRTD